MASWLAGSPVRCGPRPTLVLGTLTSLDHVGKTALHGSAMAPGLDATALHSPPGMLCSLKYILMSHARSWTTLSQYYAINNTTVVASAQPSYVFGHRELETHRKELYGIGPRGV